jgi:hypothetical protein
LLARPLAQFSRQDGAASLTSLSTTRHTQGVEMHRVAVAIAIAVVGFAPTTQAQSQWADQVSGYLATRANYYTDRGYDRTHEPEIGSLGDKDRESFNLTLHSGTTYAILAVCDNDCDDIDLKLFDSDDNLITSDVETDDYPLLKVDINRTQQYRVQVVMASCKTSPCWYGIGAYGK